MRRSRTSGVAGPSIFFSRVPASGEFGASATGAARDDTVASLALATGLVVLAALAILAYHRSRLGDLLADEDLRSATAWRVLSTVLAAVSFVARK